MVRRGRRAVKGIGLGELQVIGRSSTVAVGDALAVEVRLNWREGNAEEVALAEKTFKEFIDKGWLAIGERSGKKMQIFAFNPSLERIVLAPINMGG